MVSLLWGFIFCILGCQILTIVLLCAPLPSNAIRGRIVHSFQGLWRSSYKLRTFWRVVMFIIFLLFLDSARSAVLYTEKHKEGSVIPHEDLMTQVQRFRNQRNAYLTGFSLFLTGVIWRMMFLISQLYEYREECKKYRKNDALKKKE